MDGKLEGKHIIVFYEDGTNRVSRKDGTCSSNSDIEICLDSKIIIPKARVVRIEIVEKRGEDGSENKWTRYEKALSNA